MMPPALFLQSLYDRLGPPPLANFSPADLLPTPHHYRFAAFLLATLQDRILLIRRKPLPHHPGIENFWWLPGGSHEPGETLDQTALRETREETGLTASIQHPLLAQLAPDRPFIALFFRGTILDGTMATDLDPDSSTAEARTFASIPFESLWSDADKILLTHAGFTTGPAASLLAKNGFLAGAQR